MSCLGSGSDDPSITSGPSKMPFRTGVAFKRLRSVSPPSSAPLEPPTEAGSGSRCKEVNVMFENDLEDPRRFALAEPMSPTKEVEKYQILRVVNPFEFTFIRYADKDRCFTTSDGFKILQDMGNELMEKGETRPEQLAKNKIYITYDTRSNMWHRCRLLSIDEINGKGTVFYFDYYLEAEQIELEELREVPPDLVKYPLVPVMRGHMYDVIPKKGDYNWDTKATNWFRNRLWRRVKTWNEDEEKVKYKELKEWMGLQMSWNERRVGSDEGSDMLVDVGLVLFEDSEKVWDGMSLNSGLVRMNYGTCIGLGGSYFSSLFFFDREPIFGCDNIRLPGFEIPDSCQRPFPYYAGSRLPQVHFKKVNSLDCIYVTAVNKLEDMKAMEDYMAMCMAKPNSPLGTPLKANQIKEKEPVVWKRKDPITGEPSLVRCFVLTVPVQANEMVEALMVDSGIKQWIPKNELYPMERRIAKIQSFAHRVHLANIHPEIIMGVGIMEWHEKTRAALFQLFLKVFMEKEEEPAFFAVPTMAREVIDLQDFHQELMFMEKDKFWMRRTMLKTANYDTRQYPLIENHLVSFGVDLFFLKSDSRRADGYAPVELVIPPDSRGRGDLWELQSFSELIVKESFGARMNRDKLFNKKEYYDTLLARYAP